MSWVYRLHEWCAERIPWVQYPVPLKAVKESKAHPMTRFILFLFGVVAILVGCAGLAFAALMIWAIITQ